LISTINEEFGHIIGDRALREVGKTLAGTLRARDIVGRWGGDEFAAIVLHANRVMLMGLALRCCIRVSQTSVPSGDGSNVTLSVSIGGTLARQGDTDQGIVQRADYMMYQSKISGRGRALLDELKSARSA
jgi:diguanylate cyclase (GGDEF)-like protein